MGRETIHHSDPPTYAPDAARLSAPSFEDELLEKLDLTGGSFAQKDFTRCTFREVKMADTRWPRCRFEDCIVEGCDLSNFSPKQMALVGGAFVRCKLLGVTWADIGPQPIVSFTDCSMRYQSFVALALAKTKFVRCAIAESSFLDVDLAKATFEECDLAETLFERCALAGADFTSSRAVYFDPAKNRTRGARVSVDTAALIVSRLGLRVAGYGE